MKPNFPSQTCAKKKLLCWYLVIFSSNLCINQYKITIMLWLDWFFIYLFFSICTFDQNSETICTNLSKAVLIFNFAVGYTTISIANCINVIFSLRQLSTLWMRSGGVHTGHVLRQEVFLMSTQILFICQIQIYIQWSVTTNLDSELRWFDFPIFPFLTLVCCIVPKVPSTPPSHCFTSFPFFWSLRHCYTIYPRAVV